MKHELWYSVVVRDRHGNVISRERRRSKSFLKQWNQMVYVQFTSTAVICTDTGGTPRNVNIGHNLKMKAGAGVTTYGIRVGTGTTPVAIDDYALETPIAQGTGAGQMNYLAATIPVPVVAAPNCYFVTSRVIVNNSPAEITVREAGIYTRMYSWYGCATRDVFTTPQAVPVGGSITIDWTIQVTV